MAKSVSFLTLGCKVNQYESQAFREGILSEQMTEVSSAEPADVVVINTCVVTHKAERESRALIRRAQRRNPETKVVVTGCLADKENNGLDAFEGIEVVSNLAKNQVPSVATGLSPKHPPSSVRGLRVRNFEGRTRAFVKVQDGCSLNCSFCIIPKVRGKLRSREVLDVVEEVTELARNGHREIVLTGVHLGHFGRGKGEQDRLPLLLARLAEVPGVERIRLSSIESVELRPAVLEVLTSSRKFCPHFHLPLQAGSDRVLAAMRRRYTVAEFMAGVEGLWERFDRPSLSTDVIVGFPGESEAEFEETLALMRRAGFGRTHVFSYSDREGTDSAALKPKVAPDEIRRRANEAIRVGERLAWRYGRSFIGEVVTVLAESFAEDGRIRGYSDRYVRTHFEGEARWLGELVSVRVLSVDERGEAVGELVGAAVSTQPVTG